MLDLLSLSSGLCTSLYQERRPGGDGDSKSPMPNFSANGSERSMVHSFSGDGSPIKDVSNVSLGKEAKHD